MVTHFYFLLKYPNTSSATFRSMWVTLMTSILHSTEDWDPLVVLFATYHLYGLVSNLNYFKLSDWFLQSNNTAFRVLYSALFNL